MMQIKGDFGLSPYHATLAGLFLGRVTKMVRLEWLESFSVGNKKIDRDHKDIIAGDLQFKSYIEENHI